MPRNKSYEREEVLERAMETFWKNGYEATSVRDLEREMGINQFSIYSSFTSKKNLFLEALKKYRQYVAEKSFGPIMNEGATLSDISNFMHDFIRVSTQGDVKRGCLVVNTAGEVGSSDEDIARALRAYFEFVKEIIAGVIRNAITAGELSQGIDVEKYSSYLLGVFQGLSVAAKTLPERQLHDFADVSMMVFELPELKPAVRN
jgi:AcrR family transcriptional regulator